MVRKNKATEWVEKDNKKINSLKEIQTFFLQKRIANSLDTRVSFKKVASFLDFILLCWILAIVVIAGMNYLINTGLSAQVGLWFQIAIVFASAEASFLLFAWMIKGKLNRLNEELDSIK